MKKIISIFLLCIISLSLLTACETEDTPTVDPDSPTVLTDEEIYKAIYNGGPEKKYDLMPDYGRHKASYGYAFNETQGYNNWYYLYTKTDVTALSSFEFNSGSQEWSYDNAFISNAIMHPTSNIKVVRSFVAPIDGKVLINGNPKLQSESDSSVTVEVYVNSELKYQQAIEAGDTIGYYCSFETTLTKNDEVYFVVGTSENTHVDWNPIVDYTCQDLDTLYYLPEWGYYGDLHCYYYENVLNMYHLRCIPSDPIDQWIWYQMASDDMFLFEETPIYSVDFVKDHYMAYASAGDLNDYKTFPDGARDCTKFYDEEVGKYRYIGLGYVSRGGGHTSLFMRTSDDSEGWQWNSKAIVLRDFPVYSAGEPECAAFRKIGNRWYLYCGISGQSPHAIGRLSYWIGGEGQSIDEVDWANLETHTLDGEDLCVPQIENVNGKWYMFGWFPKTWNNFHWGGPRNLPREVIQNEDGTLSTRIDPYAAAIMNQGKLLVANETNVSQVKGNVAVAGQQISMNDTSTNQVSISGNYSSTFVTYNVKLEGTKAGMILTSSGIQIYVSIVKEADGTYLIVETPKDWSHPVNSKQLLTTKDVSDFEIKMIVEDGIIEFGVNDSIVLSARTGLSFPYTAQLFSEGKAVFTDVAIHRLAQVYDVYE